MTFIYISKCLNFILFNYSSNADNWFSHHIYVLIKSVKNNYLRLYYLTNNYRSKYSQYQYENGYYKLYLSLTLRNIVSM